MYIKGLFQVFFLHKRIPIYNRETNFLQNNMQIQINTETSPNKT